MTSPTHDATALAVALVLFPPAGDARGLYVTVGLIAAMGLAEGRANARKRREERHRREVVRELRERGVRDAEDEVEQVRWHGPRRRVTRPLRLLALVGAASAGWPLAVALACARLPDQLEVGPIDHRRLTHFLVTAGVLVLGVRHGLGLLVPAQLSAPEARDAADAFATGYATHIAADGCTRSGVPMFWPVCRDDVHLVPERVRVRGREFKVAPRTGGPVDVLVMLAALASVALAAQG